MSTEADVVTLEWIAEKIYAIRAHRVMIDSDLAGLYGVTTSALNQSVKRNRTRFPTDFMFELTADESTHLKSQIVISSGWGGRRRGMPFAFTEQGVAMLSSILKSERAVQVNIAIMRAFVALRQTLASHKLLARKLDVMEKRYDSQFRIVFDAIRALMTPPATPTRKIGF